MSGRDSHGQQHQQACSFRRDPFEDPSEGDEIEVLVDLFSRKWFETIHGKSAIPRSSKESHRERFVGCVVGLWLCEQQQTRT